MNDPVLQRSMFSGPRSAPSAPSAPSATGVGSLTTPDQNAQVLRGLFRAPPSMAFPAPGMQPVQSFQEGGEVFEPAENVADLPAENAADAQFVERRFAPPPTGGVPSASEALAANAARASVIAANAAPETPRERPIAEGIRSLFQRMFPPRMPAEAPTRDTSVAGALGQTATGAFGLTGPTGVTSGQSYRYPAPAVPIPPAAPAPAPAPAAASISTSLDEIRSRREAKEAALTASERRENGLLALMQAGFATAAGTSPNALSNIGAGGQAGIATFANLERSRREDAASRRREQLSREISTAQLQKDPDQIRTLAALGGWTPEQGREGLSAAVTRGLQVQKTTQPDPEMIRTFQILGGGDVRKGFELYNSDKKLQAAIAVTKDIGATDEDKRVSNEYIRNQLTQARTGGSSAFPGFSATSVR